MANFATKIELDDTIKELLFSFLLSGKYKVPTLSQEQEKLILDISEQFLFSGFILTSCSFNSSNKSLVEQLTKQRRTQVVRQMLVKNDSNNIAHNLNDKSIEHVFLKGTALNADGASSSGIRFSRDIDLLVRLDLLDQAYDILKTLGFRYLNAKTQDSTKYHRFGHHLPVMINDNNIKLELHWRVTRSSEFKDCPLAEKMLASRIISKANPHIFCPKVKMMIAHLIYHSFKQHRMNLGPICLFDLAVIFDFYGKTRLVDHELLRVLGIEENFKLCEQFIERARNELCLSAESKLLTKQIFENSLWLRLSRGSTISDSLVKTSHIDIFDNGSFLSRLVLKCRNIRTLYQVSYYSLNFWLALISDILAVFKGFMRRFFR